MDVGAAALIAAAGSGERLGRGPKAFVDVGGRTLLAWAIAAVVGEVDEVLVAVPPERVEEVRRRHPGVGVIAGGATRQQTVAALARATARPIVLVHDAARPFLDVATVRSCLHAAREHGAASVAARVADTLVDAFTGAAIDRDRVRAVQTPQAFVRALLLEAHDLAESRRVTATDDAALVRALGRPVHLVAGGAHLFKITTLSDLALARAYASVVDAADRSLGGVPEGASA
jgi:2-C-methyl-D-erythritol 4-phosphate cytidylyltransferase